MKTQIFFVRHGEVHNPKEIIYGRLSRFPLTKKGKSQAEQTANHLKNLQISAIYTSPLLRARQTANIIGNYLEIRPIRLSQHLLEVKSHMDGMANSFFQTSNWDFYADDIRRPSDETMEDILNRMLLFSKKIARKYPDKSIVAVSHGDPLMILKSHILNGNVTIESIRPGNNLYIGHAEVIKVVIEETVIESVSNIFKPILK
jgi:broad specificity phosphatase PhoE